MPAPRRDIGAIPNREFSNCQALVRCKKGHARATFGKVVPLVSIGMPMRCVHGAWVKLGNYPGDGCRYWIFLCRCDVNGSTGRSEPRLLSHQPMAMRSRLLKHLRGFGLCALSRDHLSLLDVNFTRRDRGCDVLR